MSFSDRFRTTLRVSGFLALVGVLLFGGAGVHQLWASGSGRPTFHPDPVEPGETFTVDTSEITVFWGQGEDLDVDDVVCTSETRTGKQPGVMPAGPQPGSEDLAVITDPQRGELVYLASNAERETRNRVVACDGPGLEAVWTSSDPRTPLTRGLGIGFVAAAVVAGLWAAFALRVTRPRPGPPRA